MVGLETFRAFKIWLYCFSRLGTIIYASVNASTLFISDNRTRHHIVWNLISSTTSPYFPLPNVSNCNNCGGKGVPPTMANIYEVWSFLHHCIDMTMIQTNTQEHQIFEISHLSWLHCGGHLVNINIGCLWCHFSNTAVFSCSIIVFWYCPILLTVPRTGKKTISRRQ